MTGQTESSRPLAVRPAKAARLLGLSERKVRDLIATERLESVRVGNAPADSNGCA
jgi:hypothetical protein